MTVSISKMSIDYYLNSAMTADTQVTQKPSDMTAYYTETETPAGRWFGAGLEGLGISDGEEVTRTAARRLYENARDPATGEPLGRPMSATRPAPTAAKTPSGRLAMGTRESVAGFDLTFSAPKSVSTLWALGDYATQTKIEAAHHQAMQETLDWVETNVAQSRAGHGGVAHVAVKGLVGSYFDHWDSREGDPQLHSHAVISNRVQRESDGQWVTLDSYTLHRHVVAISETYNSLLFDRLHDHVGTVPESRITDTSAAADEAIRAVITETTVTDADTQTDMQKSGAQKPDAQKSGARHRIELAGVPDSLIEEFSTRSTAIEARKNELLAQYISTNGKEPSQATILQLRQQATLETRTPKDSTSKASTGEAAVPLALKKHQWRQQAIAAGHDPATILTAAVNQPGAQPGTVIRAGMLNDDVIQKLSEWSLADASQQRATFTRANVVASSERVLRLVRCESADQRRNLVDSVVNRSLDTAVELTPRRAGTPTVADASVTHRGTSVFDHQGHAGLWATTETLNAESYLLDRFNDHHSARFDHGDAVAQLATVSTGSGRTGSGRTGSGRTGSGRALSDDQARASAEVLSSGRSVDAIIGPAGTGKTTTMRAVSDVWAAEYGDAAVVGLAPSAVAASVLSDELGIPTENTSKWLYEATEGAARRGQRVAQRAQRLEDLQARAGDRPSSGQRAQMESLRTQLAQDYAEQAKYTMGKDQLIIIDEASMVSTAQMTHLAQQAQNAEAKIVLVGDPAQLGAVEAGGFLGYIDRTQTPAQLDKVWRFDNEWERAASLQLRTGDTNALAAYEDHGRLHGGDDEPDATEAAYTNWKADLDAGKESILIAPDKLAVAELNARAHRELVEAGTVDIETTVRVRDDTQAGTGDLLLARRNDRSIRDSTGAFIANGTRLQVSEIHPDGSALGVCESTGGTLHLDADYLASSTELGYATTAHRAQGITTDTSHTVASTPTSTELSRELFYVGMTRGRQENHAYISQNNSQHNEQDPENPQNPGQDPENPQNSGQDRGQGHSPDPWNLMYETTQADTPREQLEPVLQRSSAERTATETKAGELAWSNDLGRAMHEREYLGWAARSTRTQEWISEHYPPETATALQSSPAWYDLANADPARTHPARTHTDTPHPDDTADQILSRCTTEQGTALDPDTSTNTGTGSGPTPIDRPAVAATACQAQMIEDADTRIENELASRRASLAADPPAWYTTLTQDHPDPQQRREALNAVIAWRALSDTDEHPQALGQAPREGDRLRPYYDRALAATTPQEPWSQDLWSQEPWSVSIPDKDRHHIAQLTKDRIEIPTPQPDREPVHTTTPAHQPGPSGPHRDTGPTVGR